MTRRGLGLVLALVLALLLGVAGLTGCGGHPTTHQTRPPASPTPPPVASEAPRPSATGCDRLTYQQAIAPNLPAGDATVPCSRTHTAQTYAVGTLSLVVDGHLLGVDSQRARSQVARKCPAGLASYLGGNEEKRRLSMLRAVWFTPTVAQAAAGADWYRCDVIALAGDQQLATMTGSLKGVLDSPRAGDWSMCATAQPGTAGFTRVPCRAKHSWRALQTVALPGGHYPGEARVRAAGQQPCRQAGRNVAADALNYRWGYEWPTAAQWAAGQTYGICWAPGT